MDIDDDTARPAPAVVAAVVSRAAVLAHAKGALPLEGGDLLQQDLLLDQHRAAGTRLPAVPAACGQGTGCGAERTRPINRHGLSLLLSCPLAVARTDPTMDEVQVNTTARPVRIHLPEDERSGIGRRTAGTKTNSPEDAQ
ncbi:hypothetical protein AB0G35_11970 [Streptomyces sp. NPDC021749]|uniref:hypothetical protein n=1 Tax=Streptomyces sp. NPDC021749 TaxID=3154905 RepID=UPI0033EB6471